MTNSHLKCPKWKQCRMYNEEYELCNNRGGITVFGKACKFMISVRGKLG